MLAYLRLLGALSCILVATSSLLLEYVGNALAIPSRTKEPLRRPEFVVPTLDLELRNQSLEFLCRLIQVIGRVRNIIDAHSGFVRNRRDDLNIS